MKYFVSLLLFYCVSGLQAQEIHIDGQVENQLPGTQVRLQVLADPFSMLLQTLASVPVDANGNFKMTFSVSTTREALLAVGLKKGRFFLQPGDHYRIKVYHDSIASKGSIFDQKPLFFDVKAAKGTINDAFSRFNEMYDAFMMAHLNDVYRFHRKGVVSGFEKQLKIEFQGDTSNYLKQSIRYRLAYLRWSARLLSIPEVAEKYFVGRPVHYQNLQYAEFFNAFFENYVASDINGPLSKSRLAKVVYLRNLKVLDDLFCQDTLLARDKRVRELVEMVVMKKYYYDRNFSSADFDILFRQMALKSTFFKNRAIANNISEKLHQMRPGMPAPSFQLPDVHGKELGLSDFKGKFVLLSFFKTDCPVCLRNLDFLATMKQNMESNFTHVTILLGNPSSVWIQKILSGNYSWPFLLLGNQLPLLERYQVRSFPAYVLLAPDGTIAMAPAPMPAEGASRRISIYISQYEKRHQSGHSP